MYRRIRASMKTPVKTIDADFTHKCGHTIRYALDMSMTIGKAEAYRRMNSENICPLCLHSISMESIGA